MAHTLEERKAELFFNVLLFGVFFHLVHGWQQIKDAQEYKQKFTVVSENTFEFIGAYILAV